MFLSLVGTKVQGTLSRSPLTSHFAGTDTLEPSAEPGYFPNLESKREPKITLSGGCDKGDARLSPRRRLPQAGVRVGDAAPAPGVSAGRGLHESDGGAAVRARGRAGVRGVAPARLWRPRPLLRRGGPRRALAVPARDHVRRVSARGAARPDRRAAARPAPGPGRLRGRGRLRPAVATARRAGRDVRVRVRGARGVGVGDARRRDAVAPRRGHRHELVAKARRPRGRGLSALRRRVRGARRVPGRARRPRRARVPAARAAVARASRRVPCGVAGAPRASFRLRPRPRRAPASNTPRAVGSSELAAVARARATLRAHRTQAEKLASAATGRAKRNQWVYDDAAGAWTSPYMERCAAAVAAVATRAAEGRPLVLLTDTAEAHGTPSNQGSARFREWRGRGERLLRALLPAAAAYCGAFAASEPDCAVRRRRGLSSFARRGEGPPADVSPAQVAEAAICRRAAEVLRFGSGTFSAFLVGDGASRPPSAQFLSCPEIERAASLPHSKS